MQKQPIFCALAALLLVPTVARAEKAAIIEATPQSYLAQIASLRPGDTLRLAPGIYHRGLPLHGLHGEAGRPITIEGDSSGSGSVFLGRPAANTVSIKNAAHLRVRYLVLDGANLPVDAVKAEGTSKFAHHITIERLTIINHGANQQIVGISTKCPAWSWVIRGNVIRGAGTGIYLGNSDGNAPFAGGVIERNLIVDSTGYALQIKHQVSRPAGMPAEAMQTVIRHNVFSKAGNGATGRMARPSVLLGHAPPSGAGVDDSFAVYGNFFHENPYEVLMQAEGNVAIQGNIFFNSRGSALRVAPHRGLPGRVEVDHNTVVAKDVGIEIAGGDRRFRQPVTANAVFAASPVIGGLQERNITGSFQMASRFLQTPFAPPGQSDFSPHAGLLELKDEGFRGVRPDSPADFFGRKYGSPTAGAVAAGSPAPWRLDLAIQPDKP
jgi:hypothetical protein